MKVLVAIASKYGSTWEIGKAIGEVLEINGHRAVVARVEDMDNIVGYDAVVLGSAVYAGRWMKPATAFVDKFRAELSSRPVWIFSSGPIGDPPKPTEEAVDATAVAAKTHAKEHMVFAGKLDRRALNFAERAITVAMGAKQGDYRDWDDVRAWANKIAQKLNDS